MSKPTINIAIGLLFQHGKVLVGWREAKQHQGNKHEFPGGKFEAGETPEQACRREIYEEVGIGLKEWYPFDIIRHEYDDIVVVLHLFYAFVPEDLNTLIQQPWAWYRRDQLNALNFPQANDAIIQRLIWPHFIKISDHLQAFKPEQDALFYWRVEAKDFQAEMFQAYSAEALTKLILNIEHYAVLSDVDKAQISTVHLKQHQLMGLEKGQLRSGLRYIAACHDQVALQHAQQIGCEAVLVSPIQATQTHPERKALGWQTLAQWSEQSHLLIFGLGGLQPDDLTKAQQNGAYGVAGIRHF